MLLSKKLTIFLIVDIYITSKYEKSKEKSFDKKLQNVTQRKSNNCS